MNPFSKDRFSAPNGAASVAAGRIASAPGAHDPSWQWALAVLTVCMLALFALFWEPARHTVHIWSTSPTFNHGFLIVPIAGYLAWRRRTALLAYPPQPYLPGLALVALAGLAWLLGAVADVMLVQQFALVGFIQAMTLTVLGRRAAGIVAFALFYLLFAVPFGKMFVPHLQNVTAYFAVEILRAIGLPVFIEGVFLSTPTGNFHVAEACSGIRFLIATVAFAFLYAHITYRTLWRRALFVGLAFVVPIIANGIRAAGIVYLAYLTDNKLAVGVDHLIYGWIFFALVTVLMIMLGQTFRESDDSAADVAPEASRGAADAPTNRRVAAAAATALIVAAVAPAYAEFIANPPISELKQAFAVPDVARGWRRVEARGRAWRPDVNGTDAQAIATFAKNGKTVTLFVAYFTHQRQGSELIGSNNRLIGGTGWSRVSSRSRRAEIGADAVTVISTRVVSRPVNRVVWHWYWVGGTFTADRYYAKLLEAASKLFGASHAGAAIAVSAEFSELPEAAEASLRDFLSGLGMLRPYLRRVTGGDE